MSHTTKRKTVEEALSKELFGRARETEQLCQLYESGRRSHHSSLPSVPYDFGINDGDNDIGLVLITGPSGSGKTEIANELKRRLARVKGPSNGGSSRCTSGIFVYGKFDQLHRGHQSPPFAAFVSAFADYVDQVQALSQTATDENGKTNRSLISVIQSRLFNNQDERGSRHSDTDREGLAPFPSSDLLDVPLLLDMIPSLTPILLPEHQEKKTTDKTHHQSQHHSEEITPSPMRILSSTNQIRLRQVFVQFLQIICDVHPVVLFLDDLQWSDLECLELLRAIAVARIPGCFALGACRGNEVSIDDPLSKCLRAIEGGGDEGLSPQQPQQRGVRVHTIELQGLNISQVAQLLATCFSFEEGSLKHSELTKLVYRKTQGNLFLLSQCVTKLERDGALAFDDSKALWVWDSSQIASKDDKDSFENRDGRSTTTNFSLTSDTSSTALQVLKTASAFGTVFHFRHLRILLPLEIVQIGLQEALDRGHISRIGRSSKDGFRFRHDQIQLAAYSLISETERAEFHWQICQRLWIHHHHDDDDHYVNIVVGQITKCLPLITKDKDRYRAATMLLQSGRRATTSSAFGAATTYFCMGIKLLSNDNEEEDDGGWLRFYDICLSLHNAAIEVCFGNGQQDVMERLIDSVLEHAVSLDDKLPALTIKILSLGSSTRLDAAIDLSLDILHKLGEHFSRHPSLSELLLDAFATRRLLRRTSTADILSLPIMTNQKKIAALKIMNLMIPYCYFARPFLGAKIATRLIRLTLSDGLNVISALGFASFCVVLAGIPLLTDLDLSYNLARLSLTLLEKFPMGKKQWMARVYAYVYGGIMHLREPISTLVEPLRQARTIGMTTGDREYAMMAGSLTVTRRIGWNINLEEIHSESDHLLRAAISYRLDLVRAFSLPCLQFVENLRSSGPHHNKDLSFVAVLTGSYMNEEEFLIEAEKSRNQPIMAYLVVLKCWIGAVVGDWNGCEATLKKQRRFVSRFTLASIASVFLRGFVSAVLTRQMKHDKGNRRRRVLLRRSLEFIGSVASGCPVNYYHMLLLLEAEDAALQSRFDNAIGRYQLSIKSAQRENYTMFAALATERLAYSTYQHDGRQHLEARHCYLEAQSLYEKWGATAKVIQLNDALHESTMFFSM